MPAKKRASTSKSKQPAKKQATTKQQPEQHEDEQEQQQTETEAKRETQNKAEAAQKEGATETADEKQSSGEGETKQQSAAAASGGQGGSSAIDIIFAFDTTVSMYPCLGEVRRNVSELVTRLFRELKDLRVGITVFGDHDAASNYEYIIRHQQLSADEAAITQFITTVPATGSYSGAESYELALHEARSQPWRSDAIKTLVVIGDTHAHEVYDNPQRLDWEVETAALKAQGVTIYGVQCLFNGIRTSRSYNFFESISKTTNGYHLFLDQFSYVRDLILAVCFHQMDDNNHRLQQYEQEVSNRSSGAGLTKSMKRLFDTMLGREVEAVANYDNYDPEKIVGALRPCPPAKYQVLEVEEEMAIKDYVLKKSLAFKAGKGFYEFTRPEQISAKKQIVLMHKQSGELFEGAAARKLAGISDATAGRKLAPSDVKDYRVFVQSTSYNRKLQQGTGFLYESED